LRFSFEQKQVAITKLFEL